MLDFSDLPYQFVPPKPNWLITSLVRSANRVVAMPGRNHRLTGIDLDGLDRIAEARRDRGARFIFLPNHPTHSDPHVMMEICRRAGVRPSFMTAYDVFARGKFGAWVMQHIGAFSVDREGSDRKAMKCAGEILAAGKFPLVIFPEGNVYLCNDRVTPFNEGAAYIGLRAQKEIGASAPVYAVPVSMKYTFIEDVRESVRRGLAGIAERFGTALELDAPITEEMRRISLTALGRYLKQRGHATPEGAPHPDEVIRQAAEQIIASLESKMDLRPRAPDDLTSRVRKIRAAVHAVRTDPDRQVDHRAAAHWADEAMLALRILGYAGGYAAEKPNLDRVAETVARLREDVTSELGRPDGRRRVLAEICQPIDLREHLEAFATKARGAIAAVTDLCEAACQVGIDRLNNRNTHQGAGTF